MFDYETLRFIWWLLIGVILVVFMISDGFDMGIGCLLPLVARNDDERRIVINSVGAHWEGNQVWLILAGGALFAAWPRVYAAAFSGFYVAMILVLCSLFFRPLAFDYRGKIADARWRKMWDAGLVIGSLVPPVVFGIAFGNLLLGVPFAFTPQLRVEYLGSFWQLLTPFPSVVLDFLAAAPGDHARGDFVIVLQTVGHGSYLLSGSAQAEAQKCQDSQKEFFHKAKIQQFRYSVHCRKSDADR